MSNKKIEILNFQNLINSNMSMINKPFDQIKLLSDNTISIVIIREPFSYFDNMLYRYLRDKKSKLFTKSILKQMAQLNNIAFLTWLDELTFIPFYNPQTFNLDLKKRIDNALEKLETFDYVVPYEELDIFIKNVLPDLSIDIEEEKKLKFSLADLKDYELVEKFIGKDMLLYQRAVELWEIEKKEDFKVLGELIEKKKLKRKVEKEKLANSQQDIKGIVDKIEAHMIAGWVSVKGRNDTIKVAIYKNGLFLEEVVVGRMRLGVKKAGIHPTGLCGFRVDYPNEMFHKNDNVEVKVIPCGFILPLGKGSRGFLT